MEKEDEIAKNYSKSKPKSRLMKKEKIRAKIPFKSPPLNSKKRLNFKRKQKNSTHRHINLKASLASFGKRKGKKPLKSVAKRE